MLTKDDLQEYFLSEHFSYKMLVYHKLDYFVKKYILFILLCFFDLSLCSSFCMLEMNCFNHCLLFYINLLK